MIRTRSLLIWSQTRYHCATESTDIMAEAAAAAGRSLAGKPGRLKWTDKMNQDLLECREKALSLKSSSNPPCYQNGRKKGYMRILKELWDDVGYVNLGLSAQNLRDHAAAITDENSQISVRGDPLTVLDETEEVGASMLSQTEGLEPAQCEGENLSNVNVVEGSNLHISSDIADQRAPQGRTATCKDPLLPKARSIVKQWSADSHSGNKGTLICCLKK